MWIEKCDFKMETLLDIDFTTPKLNSALWPFQNDLRNLILFEDEKSEMT